MSWDRYLSLSHVQSPASGCVLPALIAEISRSNEDVRTLYEAELRKGMQLLAQRLGSEALAWAFISQMVGALAMARAMPDEAGQLAILQASKQLLKRLASDLTVQARIAVMDTSTDNASESGTRNQRPAHKR